MNMTSKKAKSKSKIKDDFAIDENESMDVFTFSEGELKIEGSLLKSFSFDNDGELNEQYTISHSTSENIASSNLTSNESSSNSYDKEQIFDHRTLKTNPNGRTPPVDGEAFDMVRSYTLRRSTVRILSKIKAIHSDDNVYLNTIVDEAIRHYYEYLKNIN